MRTRAGLAGRLGEGREGWGGTVLSWDGIGWDELGQCEIRRCGLVTKQLVVHEALETIVSPAYVLSLTPITNMGASPDGAEITTFLAPPFWWRPACSKLVKTPVDSTYGRRSKR